MQFQHVIVDHESRLLFDFVNKGCEGFASGELDHLLATTAHEMVAVLECGGYVTMTAGVGVDAPDEAEFVKQRQRAVDGDESQGGAALLSPL